ncbi:MAG: hypothetical protein AAFW73_17665 [Bacteroidota bacterium]
MNLSQLQKKNTQILSTIQQRYLKGGDGQTTAEEEQQQNATEIIIVDTDVL